MYPLYLNTYTDFVSGADELSDGERDQFQQDYDDYVNDLLEIAAGRVESVTDEDLDAAVAIGRQLAAKRELMRMGL